ncbi:MAG TPA: TatD family hydrolase, partial [Thermoanaerobaculia bacterium]|nr:TatD family hydrolase [Thermoanaerobaculia bacterium]
LAEPALAPLAADLHSFAGGGAMARRLRDRPFVFGVSGMVTFKKAENVREALPLFGADQLLVETDSPYLAPVPYRGLRNEPAYVVEVAARVAAELGCEPGEIARRSRENFFRFFAKARA